jgi:hypothetical protein
MTWPPGWDSVAGTDNWSNIYFWLGILALFLLGVFEVASHRYTLRKDELVTQQQDATQKQHDEEMARLHVEAERLAAEAESSKASIADSNARAAEANRIAAEATRQAADAQLALEKLRAPRSLTEQQQRSIPSTLNKFSGQTYWAMLPTSSLDAEPLWATLSSVLDNSGWVRIDPPGLKIGTPPHGVGISQPGIHIAIAPSQKDTLSAPAIALLSALKGADLLADASLDPEAEKTPMAIAIMIGLKPQ